jgi:hypothetical protein
MKAIAIPPPSLKFIPNRGKPICPELGINPAATDGMKGQYQYRDFSNILLQ